MRTDTLRDLAPEFKVKNSGWKSRTWAFLVVLFLGIALLAEAAPHDRATAVLEKTPGIGSFLKHLGFLKPSQK